MESPQYAVPTIWNPWYQQQPSQTANTAGKQGNQGQQSSCLCLSCHEPTMQTGRRRREEGTGEGKQAAASSKKVRQSFIGDSTHPPHSTN